MFDPEVSVMQCGLATLPDLAFPVQAATAMKLLFTAPEFNSHSESIWVVAE